ncbi:MAG: ABC transporter ATP-binding protein [Actinobacteria bacterium]|nr:ABC transporter ATP-binding protein [Actinomycetota bacterium]
MSVIKIEQVSKTRGNVQVLKDLSLSLEAGSLCAVLGSSGSGKTTLLRLIAGFDQVDDGSISIGETVVDGDGSFLPSEKRGIGYVPQDAALFPHLNVAKNISFGLARGTMAKGRVAELLEMVGLPGLEQRFPHQLSGGQAQRVAIARALAIEPVLVLLDEPFGALDLSLRNSVRSDVLGLLRTQGVTTVLVTHDQDEALSEADKVAVLAGGSIAQFGAPEEVYARPSAPSLAAFVGSANLIQASARNSQVTTALGDFSTVAENAEGPVVLVVRPEQLLVGPEGDGAVSATVKRRWYYGHDSVLELEVPGIESALIARLDTMRVFTPGDRVGLTLRGPLAIFASDGSNIAGLGH